MMKEKLLFRVAECFSLPGLGMLLLPETTPKVLFGLDLHTHLRLGLRYTGGFTTSVVASVEEIGRTNTPVTRALLLAEVPIEPVPAGTEVWWDSPEATAEL